MPDTPAKIETTTGRHPAAAGKSAASLTFPPPPRKHDWGLRILVGATAVLVIVVAIGYYLRFIDPYESTDDAFIDGHATSVAPQVSGRVARLLVKDNQEIKKGDVLLEIDPRDYETRMARARANLAAAGSRLEQAKAQLAVDHARSEQERANVTAAEADATRAEADLKRYQAVESRAVSRSQIDLAKAQARMAAAQFEVARDREHAAEAQVGLSKVNIETAAADVQQNEATVHQAELDLSYTKITASSDGRVTHRTVEEGNYVQVGQALLAIVHPDVWVTANFKETQLTHMKPGQRVWVKVDAYPNEKFRAHVESIQAGTGAQFSLLPPENAAGNYVKVVQRIPVKIVFEKDEDPKDLLGLGMSVVPKVKVK